VAQRNECPAKEGAEETKKRTLVSAPVLLGYRGRVPLLLA